MRTVRLLHRRVNLGLGLGLLMTFVAWSAPTQANEVSVLDDEQNTITLAQPASRIISLAPSMTELLYSLGAGDRIVGVMAHSDFPPDAASLPVVGRHDLLDMEGILALNPDLIVAWRSGNPRSSLQRLRELGFTIYVAEPESLASISSHLSRLGTLTGQQAQADMLVNAFDRQIETLHQRYGNREPVSVFYQVWHSPIVSVGGRELVNDMIDLCGGRNIFSDLGVGPTVDRESVILRNPDVILASGSDRTHPRWLEDWRDWPGISAVANNHLYALAPELVQRHSLRALQGARQMCEHIDQAR